jgi:hypothetical protein
MSWAVRTGSWLAVALAAAQYLYPALGAQAPAPPAGRSNGVILTQVHTPIALEPPTPLPAIPNPRSPVAVFRELLAMNAAERRQAVTNRSPEDQKIILAKVREYQAMDPDRREERLQVTELRWYLLPLMRAPAVNRAAQIEAIPARLRKFVEDRLREWDQLPPDVQKELLANEATIHYFTEIEGRTDEQRRKILEGMSAARRKRLEEGIEQWSRMPEDRRRTMISRFNQFFDLASGDKEKALRTISGPERRQIEKTLQTFGNLPPDQRAKCVRAIEKYVQLSLEDRQQFWKNAERWKLLTPTQRQAWRELVDKLPPPMPLDLPPMPSTHPTARPSPALVTNGK